MARTVNNLHLHIPDLSPPKLHRPRILRSRSPPGESEERPRHELPEPPTMTGSESPEYPILHELPDPPGSPGSHKSLETPRAHGLPRVPAHAKDAHPPLNTQQQSRQSSPPGIVSPMHVLMFIAGLAAANLHILLVVFCILGLLVLAAIRNDDPSQQEVQTVAAPQHQKRTRKVVRPKPRQPLRLDAVNSVDEKFAFRPYG